MSCGGRLPCASPAGGFARWPTTATPLRRRPPKRAGPTTTSTRSAGSCARHSSGASGPAGSGRQAGAGHRGRVRRRGGDARAARRGWRVLAIDASPEAAEVLRPRVPGELADRLEIRSTPVEDAELPPFDLLYAGYTLPFAPEAFDRFWAQTLDHANPGGYLVVNLFGTHDTWAGRPDMRFHERAHRTARGRARHRRPRRDGGRRAVVPRSQALARVRRDRPQAGRVGLTPQTIPSDCPRQR